MLLERWELAKGGGGQAVFVTGEAGIGKSRLVQALVERIQQERHEFIRLQCSPYHTTSALYPVIQRLSWIAGLASGDDLAARAEKLDRLLAYYGEDAAECGAIYAELLSLDLGDGFDLPGLSAQQRKEITLRTLVNRPFLAAARAPVLLVVEDAHWIDPSTSELLREMVLRIHAGTDLRGGHPSAGMVSGLGERPFARHGPHDRTLDQAADARTDRIRSSTPCQINSSTGSRHGPTASPSSSRN